MVESTTLEPADVAKPRARRAARCSGAGLQVAATSGIDRRIRRREPSKGAGAAKILIANRGEIAIRVMRTCRELGIATVAVYSELDRDAAHVRYADEAYALGGQTAAESYLNTEAILDAIRASAAPTACTRATASSPRTPTSPARSPARGHVDRSAARGDRDHGRQDLVASRRAAQSRSRAFPGTTTPITDASEIVAFGDEYGYPIAIKAAYGGGGRGMKVVEQRRGRGVGVRLGRSARRRRTSAATECYMERYLTRPAPRRAPDLLRHARQRRVL